MLHKLLKVVGTTIDYWLLAEFKPLAGRICVKPPRPQICGLAEFKPKLLLSRPEIYSKPAWGLVLTSATRKDPLNRISLNQAT